MKTKLPTPFVMWENHVRYDDSEEEHDAESRLRKGRAVIVENPTGHPRNKHEVPYVIRFEVETTPDLLGKQQWRQVTGPFVEFMSDMANNFLNSEKGEPA